MFDFLPCRISDCLNNLNYNLVYEIRIRADKPLVVNLGGEFKFLGTNGICQMQNALIPTENEVEDTLMAACGYSVYAVENQLKEGFITTKDGVRLGIAGTVVYENGRVHAIRNATSLCVRIPHEIRGCADEIYAKCFEHSVVSTLILAPPGEGKTTILRELTRLISERTQKNILVSDERGELSAGFLGSTVDVVLFADKRTSFTQGIRAMRPQVIVTDELMPEDYATVKAAMESGIDVIASAHLKSTQQVPAKIFGQYVILSALGKVKEIVIDEKLCGSN